MPSSANSFFGFYRALVIDTKDPQFMGRVKVRIPDLMVDPVNTGDYCSDGLWAHPANNYLGGRNINDTSNVRCDMSDAQYQGSCLIPPKGSHVFVFFEKGDPNRPFYFASAEYGETIVPPENRIGPDYDKKWTLLKTHQGRTIIVSDDDFDSRVEITGKKRLMENPPFGDAESVFAIDDNQTVFLIDERENNEKVFLKDYRGNYIKMIQNEDSSIHGKRLNDQLHIYMHDDIHIDTPKNIYITAGENIHIRAGNDIYINALHDMFIKARNELKEMAHKIDRYSETSDNRHADTDINDHASNVINRQGVNQINDITIKFVRNVVSMIADVSGGKVSIQSGSMTNISSGGTIMIMGSQTLTQTSSAPESVSTSCKIADMTPNATPAKPDKERYQGMNENITDYPKQYVGNVTSPYSFDSKISQLSQPYNTVVGGVSMPPYVPPKSRENVDSIRKDANSQVPVSPSDNAKEKIEVSSKKKKKSIFEMIKDSVTDIYENLRDKSKAVALYTSGITGIMNTAYNIVKKQVDNVTEFSSKVVTWVKRFFTSNISKVNNNIVSLIKTDWKMFADEENDESNSNSTLSQALEATRSWIQSIKDSKEESQQNWKSYLTEVDTELASYEDNIINNELYYELESKPYDEKSALSIIKNKLTEEYGKIKDVFGDGNGFSEEIRIASESSMSSMIASFSSSVYNRVKSTVSAIIRFFTKNILDKSEANGFDSFYSNSINQEITSIKSTIESDSASIAENSPNLVSGTMDALDFESMNQGMTETFNAEMNEATAEFSTKLDQIAAKYDESVQSTMNSVDVDAELQSALDKNEPMIAGMTQSLDGYILACSSIADDPNFMGEYAALWESSDEVTPNDITNLVIKYASKSRNELSSELNIKYGVIPAVEAIDEATDEISNTIIGDSSTLGSIYGESQAASEAAKEQIDQLKSLSQIEEVLNNEAQTKYMDESLSQVDQIIKSGSYFDADVTAEMNKASIDESLEQLISIVENGSTVDVTSDTTTASSISTYITDSIKTPVEYLTNMSPPEPETTANSIVSNIPSVSDMASSVSDSIFDCVNNSSEPVSNYVSGYDFNSLSNNMFSTIQSYCGTGDSSKSSFTDSLCSLISSPVSGLSNAVSKSNNFLSNVRNKLTLSSNPFDFAYSIANGPSQFTNQMTSNINSMLNRCKNAVTGMSPISDALTLLDTLRNSIYSANSCVNNFKYGVLENLESIIESPITLKNQFNNYLESAIYAIENMQSGGSVIDRIKENAGYSFMNALSDVLNPLKSISSVTESLSNSLHTMFDNFNPFDAWNSDNESILDTITSIFEDEVTENVSNTVINNSDIQQSIDDIWEEIKDKDPEDLTQEDIDNINNKIEDIIEKEEGILTGEDTIKDSVIDPDTGEIRDEITDAIEDSIKDSYPTEDNVSEDIGNKLDDVYNEVIEDQKDVIEDNIVLDDNQINDQFSKYNPINKLHTVPSSCGIGYQYLLFMKRKYINTIPVLLSSCGANYLSFSLLKNIDILKSYVVQYSLMDDDVVNDYINILSNYNSGSEVIKNTPWWNNLDFILKQCEIYSIDLFITIYDFRELPPFNDNYTTNDWGDKQKRFIKDICDFINYRVDSSGNIIYDADGKPEKRLCHCILNFGYGSYSNPDDLDNEKYPIYPMSGYLREMIMYMAYECNFTSNMMAITANESNNIYYYNPYSEWKSYDDLNQHTLENFDVTAEDCVDGLINGEAHSVLYDEDSNVSGGYCNFLINCSKYSLPIMSMYDFSDKMNELKYVDMEGNKISVVAYHTENGEIHPNIMNDIFNPSSRNCIRYFKKSNYFDVGGYIQFDTNGDVVQ